MRSDRREQPSGICNWNSPKLALVKAEVRLDRRRAAKGCQGTQCVVLSQGEVLPGPITLVHDGFRFFDHSQDTHGSVVVLGLKALSATRSF